MGKIPNQYHLYIKKPEKYTTPFYVGNCENTNEAFRKLTKSGFGLYMWFLQNQANYDFELFSVKVQKDLGFCAKTYDNAIADLKKNGYSFKLTDDKKTILVPASQKDAMRLYVAENDLIQNSNPGFELLDNMQLGSTDFKNNLTKQRIFQGELTRSIEKMQGIKSVRVQLAQPERSIFEDKDEIPSASVMLILDPGYKLKSSQVKAIKNLVAYSVPRLTPEKVFITDQFGNSLSDETSKNSNDMESFKSGVEKDTAKKITSVLEEIVGRGNVMLI